ncbi:MAG TPA: hypothetical protein VM686_25230 [Polyangiaceae bacterium]|nr:hypothetical protein [Polyangiaceae bacterium]
MSRSAESMPSPADAGLAAESVYDENGVDLTLVRYTLSLSPTQRLKAVENYMKAMASVKPISRAPQAK